MAKVIGITGVAGGIGQALVKEFQRRGFDVIGVDIIDNCPGVHYFRCDLTDEASSLKTFNEIKEKFPEIDYWFNNAGLARLGEFLDVGQEDFEEVMKVNFNSQVIGTRFWLSFFQQKGKGFIINMASIAGLVPGGGMASYVASKFACVGFTRSLQIELEASHSPVSMILVTPGFVETQIMQIGTKYGFPEKLRKLISSPESCAREIVSGILAGKKEITPTINGKIMASLYRLPLGEHLPGVVFKKIKKTK